MLLTIHDIKQLVNPDEELPAAHNQTQTDLSLGAAKQESLGSGLSKDEDLEESAQPTLLEIEGFDCELPAPILDIRSYPCDITMNPYRSAEREEQLLRE